MELGVGGTPVLQVLTTSFPKGGMSDILALGMGLEDKLSRVCDGGIGIKGLEDEFL